MRIAPTLQQKLFVPCGMKRYAGQLMVSRRPTVT